jgi:hypothetical protein
MNQLNGSENSKLNTNLALEQSLKQQHEAIRWRPTDLSFHHASQQGQKRMQTEKVIRYLIFGAWTQNQFHHWKEAVNSRGNRVGNALGKGWMLEGGEGEKMRESTMRMMRSRLSAMACAFCKKKKEEEDQIKVCLFKPSKKFNR